MVTTLVVSPFVYPLVPSNKVGQRIAIPQLLGRYESRLSVSTAVGSLHFVAYLGMIVENDAQLIGVNGQWFLSGSHWRAPPLLREARVIVVRFKMRLPTGGAGLQFSNEGGLKF
jgi:hypothetical protein